MQSVDGDGDGDGDGDNDDDDDDDDGDGDGDNDDDDDDDDGDDDDDDNSNADSRSTQPQIDAAVMTNKRPPHPSSIHSETTFCNEFQRNQTLITFQRNQTVEFTTNQYGCAAPARITPPIPRAPSPSTETRTLQ